MSYPTAPRWDFPPKTPRTRVTGLWHDPSPLQHSLAWPMLCKLICMGNVKWHALFVVFLWNVLETGWNMLICVKHANQLVEVISIMWIKFKWEPPGAETPEEWQNLGAQEMMRRGWTQCSSNHNTFTNPFLKTAGGNPTCSSPSGIGTISSHISLVPSGLTCEQ